MHTYVCVCVGVRFCRRSGEFIKVSPRAFVKISFTLIKEQADERSWIVVEYESFLQLLFKFYCWLHNSLFTLYLHFIPFSYISHYYFSKAYNKYNKLFSRIYYCSNRKAITFSNPWHDLASFILLHLYVSYENQSSESFYSYIIHVTL